MHEPYEGTDDKGVLYYTDEQVLEFCPAANRAGLQIEVHAIGDAAAMIARGDADLMVAGGAESAVNVLGLAGFARMKAVTSDFNDTPEKASRPWDKNRSGFVMGEGSGALVLEELEHAKARGAKIYAELVGYGMSGDAYHITAPSGDGAYRAMKMAADHAKEHGVELSDIGYINAHGTSTPAGDVGEAMAVKRLFGDEGVKNVSMSSTKSAVGHLLGAAGAVEAVYSIMAIQEQICPPTLNLDDPAEVKARHVRFHAFTLVHLDEPMVSWGERMHFLEELGFDVVDREATTAQKLPEAIDRWTKLVESGKMDIPVDGLVICYDDTDYAASGSVTGHHATRAGFAFKWQDEAVDTKLKYIEWSCAVSTISPVAVFEPVQIEGTTVSRASLCNISEIERLGIGKECTLSVIKANKIIPKCIAVKDAVGAPEIPSQCPVCHAPTKVHVSENSGTKTLHCTNPDCTAKNVKKFTRFVSKWGMDIDGLSIQTMLRFMNAGFIHEFADIFRLKEHFGEISQMEGFGEKSVANMEQSIEKSRQVHPVNFIFALCIPLIGVDAGKKIVAAIGFEGFLQRLHQGDGFEDIEGIGAERSRSIVTWYQNEKNHSGFEDLLHELSIEHVEVQDTSSGSCAGLSFVITGDVHHYKNRDEFKAYVESQGGKVTGSVSKKTAYLVNNDVESASSKNRKAKELGIPIISEDGR